MKKSFVFVSKYTLLYLWIGNRFKICLLLKRFKNIDEQYKIFVVSCQQTASPQQHAVVKGAVGVFEFF